MAKGSTPEPLIQWILRTSPSEHRFLPRRKSRVKKLEQTSALLGGHFHLVSGGYLNIKLLFNTTRNPSAHETAPFGNLQTHPGSLVLLVGAEKRQNFTRHEVCSKTKIPNLMPHRNRYVTVPSLSGQSQKSSCCST